MKIRSVDEKSNGIQPNESEKIVDFSSFMFGVMVGAMLMFIVAMVVI